MVEMPGEGDQNLEENKALVLGRPRRKRKPVHFYGPAKFRKNKPLRILEGNGVKLGDIKKVSSNLRNREIDADLRYFHVILYGVKVKNKDLKRNILRFSGFLWGPQEEERKEKKLQRKVAKYKKYQLLDICNLLGIRNVTAESTKKEISEKLITFLKCPHDFRNAQLDEVEEVTNPMRTETVDQSSSSEMSSKGDEVGDDGDDEVEEEEYDEDEEEEEEYDEEEDD
ncbi:Armadillo-type fold-containing protein [Dioscorea alata]|uniref:Armadillo-type fold-containing protein n=1 Tax=Dioscorea alata TaxID=55571 RepID=A0ACB7V9K0_DIOAL|nr:Armadillo-type fold-containing protein [Dioscorea alata]